VFAASICRHEHELQSMAFCIQHALQRWMMPQTFYPVAPFGGAQSVLTTTLSSDGIDVRQ